MGMCDCSLSTFECNEEMTDVPAGNQGGEAWMTCISCLQVTVDGHGMAKNAKNGGISTFSGYYG